MWRRESVDVIVSKPPPPPSPLDPAHSRVRTVSTVSASSSSSEIFAGVVVDLAGRDRAAQLERVERVDVAGDREMPADDLLLRGVLDAARRVAAVEVAAAEADVVGAAAGGVDARRAGTCLRATRDRGRPWLVGGSGHRVTA